MDEYITLSDGTVFHNSHVLESDGHLYVYVNSEGQTMKTVFDALYESPYTQTIHAFRFDQDRQYTGYTHLTNVGEDYGQIAAVLRKAN